MIRVESLLPFCSAILSAALILAAGFRPLRRPKTVRFFFLLNVSIIVWLSAYFVSFNWGTYADPSLAPPGSVDYFVGIVMAAGVAGTITYWMLFAAAAAHNRFWTSRVGVVLANLPIVYLVAAVATNPWHHLFMSIGDEGRTAGPLSFPHYALSLVLGALGLWYIISHPLTSGTSSGKRQAAMIGLAGFLPFIGATILTFATQTGRQLAINPVPVMLPVLNAVLGYQVLYKGLGEVMPLSTLAAIMENTEIALAYLDHRLHVVSVNTAFVKNSAHTENELVGAKYFELFPDSSRESLFEFARESSQTVTGREVPGLFPDPPNSPARFWDWMLSPVKDAGGELSGFVLSVTEVTDSVRGQELARTLQRLDERLHSDFSSDEAVREAVAEAAEAIGVESASLAMIDGREIRLQQCCERPDAFWEPFIADDFPHLDRVLHDRTVLCAEDTTAVDDVDASKLNLLGLRSVLAIPLMYGGHTLGAVSFETRTRRTSFPAANVRFAEQLASSLALALENARRFESERRIAQTLQESMLNMPHEIRGLDFAHIYRSASEAARVGGDFYDLFELEEGHLGLLVGDVAGHGLDAAVLTSLVKNTVRAQAYETLAPAVTMAKTNEILRRQTTVEQFATAFFAVLDPATGELAYCNAGHPFSLIARGSHGVSLLDVGSPVLGVIEGAEYAEGRARLQAGDVLLMYTDGVTEARDGSELFGEQRLIELLSDLAGHDPHDIVQAVFDAVFRHAKSELSDDVALLAARLAPHAVHPKRRRADLG